jgi:hypothetical protein
MHVAWDHSRTIRPIWKEDRHPVLDIPAAMQKNDTEESIPLLPWFEKVLLETPESERTGWSSLSLQLRHGRHVHHHRPNAEWGGQDRQPDRQEGGDRRIEEHEPRLAPVPGALHASR